MKSVDVKSNTYINSSKEMNDKNPKFKPKFGIHSYLKKI